MTACAAALQRPQNKTRSSWLACRLHAVFFTDKVCCEPLTELLHFTDVQEGQPDYMVKLVSTIQALGFWSTPCVERLKPDLRCQPESAKLGACTACKKPPDSIPQMLRNEKYFLPVLLLCTQTLTPKLPVLLFYSQIQNPNLHVL